MQTCDPAETIASAFKGNRWLQGYVRGKLRADPVFHQACKAMSQGSLPVVDLGCGLGLLGMWLRLHGIAREYRGCDLGGWKITAGKQAVARLGMGDLALEEADMCHFRLEGPSVICVFDVIHYLGRKEQSDFLRSLAAAACKGSLVLLRTGVKHCGWRSWVTVAEEWWTRSTGWIQGGRVNFPRLDELESLFETEGCRVRIRPLWGRTPFSSHWLEVCGRD